MDLAVCVLKYNDQPLLCCGVCVCLCVQVEDDEKKLQRAKRFGEPVLDEKMKKRAERFGTS